MNAFTSLAALMLRFNRVVTLLLIAGFAGHGVAMAEPHPASIAVSPAAESATLPPLSARFSEDHSNETPDFQKHVMPLLGRLGCNGRSCHGSFQGRGGFQLSLFGYDFAADHTALVDPATGRIDMDDVEESLVLAKPSDADIHEGGKLFDATSWQYRVLKTWIDGDAKFNREIQSLVTLEVQPTEVRFSANDQKSQLRAVAVWADGTREDVTELCRFNSNDDSIAEIDAEGLIRSGEFGDTHVVVSYDRAVVPIPVMRAVESREDIVPPRDSEHPIDRLVGQKLQKLNITASPICTDAEFIRRASLDITGTLPGSADVRTFLADRSPEKRTRLIEDLLDAPGYAAWWATRLSDWTGNSEAQLNNAIPIRGAATRLWYEWLRVRLEDNMPYDEIVEGIVTAQTRQGDESYMQYCENMTAACQPGNEDQFAAREGMPLYWARRNFAKPEERAIGFAYAFLGVRIECAQCHKHPFDQWSKDDFDQFAKLFASIRAQPNNLLPTSKRASETLVAEITGGKKLDNGDLRKLIAEVGRKGTTVPFFELTYNAGRLQNQERQMMQQAKARGEKYVAKIPTGNILGQPEPLKLDRDPRGELMAWLRQPSNPYFARAIVNRVWSNYFGIGIIDPTDDMNLGNPPSNAALLDDLAGRFVEHGYDLNWLSREITTSDAYQRSMLTNATNEGDRVNFSHHLPRRLPAEVIHDAVLLATESTKEASKIREQLDEMAIANSLPLARNNRNYIMTVFGQSVRESNCDCDRSDSPSLLQSIYLRNDFDMIKRLGDKDAWVAQAIAQLGGTATDLKDRQAQQRADQIRTQLAARLERLDRATVNQKPNISRKLTNDLVRMNQRLEPLGFRLPSAEAIIANPDGWELIAIKQPKRPAAGKLTVVDIIDEAYLRTLTRFPEPSEKQIAREFIADSKSINDGVTSLMWALVNTKEFIITH